MPNLFIFSAKFDCLLLVLSRPAFSVLLKNLPFRPAESVFFAPSLAGLLVNLRAEKINLLAKKMYDQREINNLMFNLIG